MKDERDFDHFKESALEKTRNFNRREACRKIIDHFGTLISGFESQSLPSGGDQSDLDLMDNISESSAKKYDEDWRIHYKSFKYGKTDIIQDS